MGIFSEWQPRYAEVGVATFPVVIDGKQKKPAVSNYRRMGANASSQLVFRFPDHDAIGLMCGRRNGITVLDVDNPDDQVLADALANHGATPLVVRSGSGKFHAYYRHNGERRQIRQYRGGLPIDLCGAGGMVVGSPSKGANGDYEIIHGRFDDIERLPVMHGLEFFEPIPSPKATGPGAVSEFRHVKLIKHCMMAAKKCTTLDDLFGSARSRNLEFASPLPDKDVAEAVEYAWKKTEAGENWCGAPGMVVIDHDVVDRLTADPDAFVLLSVLKRHHEGAKQFILANAMAAETFSWGLRRWKDARARLVAGGFIRCIHPGGKGEGDPPLYGWPRCAFQHTNTN
jgi:hypothetical protein